MKKLSYEYVQNFINSIDGYTLISNEYKNCKEKIKVKHNCGNIYEVTFDNFKNGKRCPICSKKMINKNKKLNNDSFKIKLYKKYNNDYIVLGNYINNRTKIKVKHKCGYIYETRPDNLLQGYQCPVCKGNKKLNTEQFKKKVYNKYNNEYTVLGKYINTHTKILIRHNCDKCFHNEFLVRPSNFLSNGTICPICAKSSKSKGERAINKWLIKNNFNFKREYVFEDCKDKSYLRFDFCLFLNNKKYLIEYDGIQHFKSTKNKRHILEKIQKRDRIKNIYCEDNNIPLLRIKYTEYKNIDKILSETFNDYL